MTNPATAAGGRRGFQPALLFDDPRSVNHYLIDRGLTFLEVGSRPRGALVLFEAGQVRLTRGAAWLFRRIDRDPRLFLYLHLTGTWGCVDRHMAARNRAAAEEGYGRIESLYELLPLFGLALTLTITTTLGPGTTTEFELCGTGGHHAVAP